MAKPCADLASELKALHLAALRLLHALADLARLATAGGSRKSNLGVAVSLYYDCWREYRTFDLAAVRLWHAANTPASDKEVTALEEVLRWGVEAWGALWPDEKDSPVLRRGGLSDEERKKLLRRWRKVAGALQSVQAGDIDRLGHRLDAELGRARIVGCLPEPARSEALLRTLERRGAAGLGQGQPAPQGPAQQEAPAGPPCIYSLGGRRYQADGHPPVIVTEREDWVLRAFAQAPVMDQKTLINRSGVTKAPVVLGQLKEKYNGIFRAAIHCPGGRGKGGYRVSVKAAVPAPPAGRGT
jgi:hypothetical protein